MINNHAMSTPLWVVDLLTTTGSSSVTISTFSNAPLTGGLPLPTSSTQVKHPAATMGLPPYIHNIPTKSVIISLEYVEMAELLVNRWTQEESESHCCGGHLTHSVKRGPVTDIVLWLDCYASLVAVLCSRYPDKIEHFIMYQKNNH